MGLHDHQYQHQGKHRTVRHQFQKADALQPVQSPPGERPVGKLLFPLGVPLGQPGREKQDHRHLGNLGRLKGGAGHQEKIEPAFHLIDLYANGRQYQHQQRNRAHQHKDRHPAKTLVIDLGCHIHHQQTCRGIGGLPSDVEHGVVLYILGRVIVGRGKGSGKHHDEPDPHQHEHQHQEGQVHGAAGQLLLHGQVTFCFSGDNVHLL